MGHPCKHDWDRKENDISINHLYMNRTFPYGITLKYLPPSHVAFRPECLWMRGALFDAGSVKHQSPQTLWHVINFHVFFFV